MSLANGSATREAKTGTSVRAGLVAALATVEGITAYPVVPDQATAGAAWPKWITTTYDGHLCELAVRTYDVLVTLPSSYVAVTVDQGDTFEPLVTAALRKVGRVEIAEPRQITFNDRQSMPGLRLRIVT